ncbi:septal ring lytic transglycosylase RlpA family protein [Hyphomicrobium sp.]|uniref:septal ring lytic transglycosylase RlpA family protein n=1 Tax=Hyphomicrobium sp. TaxID=82 RepID=UPI002C52E038|nr:septal ring lytic transglycosylase RlpA family protein [Hyphomicrobium sp.]HVZ04641.1 septal ring lytic transglycosylase RlpA family protein [Hyphomicrobium sp.]
MHRSTRAGFVLALNLAAVASASPLRAEYLVDGLAGPASRALKMATWTVKTARRPILGSWRPKVSVTLTVPKRRVVAAAAVTHIPQPYGLHGPQPPQTSPAMTGLASYYGASAGTVTATGEHFDPSGLTAAHRTLPFGTRVRVTRVDTGQSVIVRINDRGPFKRGRVIDLSEGAARTLKMTDVGLTNVRLEVLN